jgi:hypothetical protein
MDVEELFLEGPDFSLGLLQFLALMVFAFPADRSRSRSRKMYGEGMDMVGVEARTEGGEAEFLDRRQHKRYATDAMAEVMVEDGTMLFRGRVLDVSVAGCYVETQAQLRLETGTRVEMVFNINGVTFRPAATARMMRAGSGAGFRFLNVNAKTQLELETLISALAAGEVLLPG